MTKHLDAADLAATYEAGKAEGERLAAQGTTLHDAGEQARLAAEANARHAALVARSERLNGRVA